MRSKKKYKKSNKKMDSYMDGKNKVFSSYHNLGKKFYTDKTLEEKIVTSYGVGATLTDEEKLRFGSTVVMDKFSSTLKDAGASPAVIYACHKTDRFVTENNYHLLEMEDRKEYDDAVAEYEEVAQLLKNNDTEDDNVMKHVRRIRDECG